MALTRFNIDVYLVEDDYGDDIANFSENVRPDGIYCWYEEADQKIRAYRVVVSELENKIANLTDEINKLKDGFDVYKNPVHGW